MSYKEKNGNTLIHIKYNDGGTPHLGRWAYEQRKKYNNLVDDPFAQWSSRDQERIKKLNSIEFDWNLALLERRGQGRDEASWDACYQRLLAYGEKHGSLNVPNRYNDGLKPLLGRWVNHQRREYSIYHNTNGASGRITQDRIDKLNAIDFQWSIGDVQWESVFEE